MFINKLSSNKEHNVVNGNHKHKATVSLSQISEAYKNARSNLLFAMASIKSEKGKIIMLTSAEPGEGKTTTCLNIASVFGETNAKVLIIDADLRRPKIETYLTEKREQKGLSDVLGGFCKLEEVIHRPEGCSFDCIYSGNIPPNPSELLMSDKVKTILDELSETYDYIFLDTPPVGVVSETLYLTQLISGVVLIARQKQTHAKKMSEVIAQLKFANANILGFVLNGAEITQKKYYNRGKYYYYRQNN